MQKRKIYLRKKKDKYVFETKIKGKTIHLINLPTDYNKFLLELSRLIEGLCEDCSKLNSSSFFTKEKMKNLREKLKSADIKKSPKVAEHSKGRTINLIRTKENGRSFIDDEIDELVERAG